MVMAFMFMAYMVMAYMVMAYVVMAVAGGRYLHAPGCAPLWTVKRYGSERVSLNQLTV